MNVILAMLAILGGLNAVVQPRQYQIEVAVLSGDPLGSRAEGTIKSLAEPVIASLNGQQANFLLGSGLPANGEKRAQVGIEAKLTVTAQPDGTARLDHKFALHQRDPNGRLRTDSREASQAVKFGEKIRVRIASDSPGSQTWAEITVTEVSRGK